MWHNCFSGVFSPTLDLWKDVYVIRTKLSKAEMVDTGKLKRKRGNEKETVIKPKCVVELKHWMSYESGSKNIKKMFS